MTIARAGRKGDGTPYGIGAGDGSPAAVAPLHLVMGGNVDQATSWDPPGYDAAYRRVRGR